MEAISETLGTRFEIRRPLTSGSRLGRCATLTCVFCEMMKVVDLPRDFEKDALRVRLQGDVFSPTESHNPSPPAPTFVMVSLSKGPLKRLDPLWIVERLAADSVACLHAKI